MRRDKSRGAHMPSRVEPEVTLRDWLRMYHQVLKEWDEAWVVWMSLDGYAREHHPGLLQYFEAWQQGVA